MRTMVVGCSTSMPVLSSIHHLVSLKVDGRDAEFPAVFDVFERLVVEGDSSSKTLARSATSRACR